MHIAIIRCLSKGDHPQIIQLLLEHGANPNAQDNKREMPLHLVSTLRYLFLSSRLEFACILLAHGVNVDAEDEEGETPLQLALARGWTKLAQLLSEYCSK